MDLLRRKIEIRIRRLAFRSVVEPPSPTLACHVNDCLKLVRVDFNFLMCWHKTKELSSLYFEM